MNQSAKLPPILVIDDSADDRFLIERLLAKAGAVFPVLAFSDAADAVGYLSSALASREAGAIPLAVFTDLKMPGMSGVQFVEWTRSQRRLGSLPVYMVSSSNDAGDLERSVAAGVDRYFIKYPSVDEVRTVLDSAGCLPYGGA